MPPGDLNLKKSWHPGLHKNQAIVHAKEQQALEERRRIQEKQREIRLEREKNEILRLQEIATSKKRIDRVDWMYTDPTNSSRVTSSRNDDAINEEYLLGKRRIDNIIKNKIKGDLEAFSDSLDRFVPKELKDVSNEPFKVQRDDPMADVVAKGRELGYLFNGEGEKQCLKDSSNNGCFDSNNYDLKDSRDLKNHMRRRSRRHSRDCLRDCPRDRSRNRSRDRSRRHSRDCSKHRSKHHLRDLSRDRSRNRSKHRSRHRSRNRSRDRSRDRLKHSRYSIKPHSKHSRDCSRDSIDSINSTQELQDNCSKPQNDKLHSIESVNHYSNLQNPFIDKPELSRLREHLLAAKNKKQTKSKLTPEERLEKLKEMQDNAKQLEQERELRLMDKAKREELEKVK